MGNKEVTSNKIRQIAYYYRKAIYICVLSRNHGIKTQVQIIARHMSLKYRQHEDYITMAVVYAGKKVGCSCMKA